MGSNCQSYSIYSSPLKNILYILYFNLPIATIRAHLTGGCATLWLWLGDFFLFFFENGWEDNNGVDIRQKPSEVRVCTAGRLKPVLNVRAGGPVIE